MAKRSTYRTRGKRVTPVTIALFVVLACVCALAVYGSFCTNGFSRSTAADTDAFEAVRVIHVSDGDTLLVRRASGEEAYVRLIGCDAPESVNPDETLNTPEGEAAAAFLRTLVAPGSTVYLARDISDTDKYGRLLRYVWLEVPADPMSKDEVRTKMLNGIMVDAGHASVTRFAPDTAYFAILSSIARTASA